MGFFRDLWGSFFGRDDDAPDFGDERLNKLWEEADELLPENVHIDEDTFREAFVDTDISSEARREAREEFESLLSQFHHDIAEFDWDAWRDWYESQ